jgi:hypothetical protein
MDAKNLEYYVNSELKEYFRKRPPGKNYCFFWGHGIFVPSDLKTASNSKYFDLF